MKLKITIIVLVIICIITIMPNVSSYDEIHENDDELFPINFNFGLYNELTESEYQFHYLEDELTTKYYNLTLNQSYILGIFFIIEVNKDSILGSSYINELDTWVYFQRPDNTSTLIPSIYKFNGQASNVSRWGYSVVYDVPPETFYINQSGKYDFIVVIDITDKSSNVNRYYNNYSLYINIEYIPPKIPDMDYGSIDSNLIQFIMVTICGISLIFVPTFFTLKIRNSNEKLKYGTYMFITIIILGIMLYGLLAL